MRSIRHAFPDLKLIGIEYSSASTGMTWEDFDEIRVNETAASAASWNDIADALGDAVLRCAAFIPGYDPEVWLRGRFRGSENMLSPDRRALESVSKPDLLLAGKIGLHVPASLPGVSDSSDERALQFCERNDWNVWAKSVWYGAVPVSDRSSLVRAVEALEAEWGPGSVWLQAHVEGAHETVAYCAHEGELLGSALLRKIQTTPAGKVWSGSVSSVPDKILEPLAAEMLKLRWTGGGELELVRDTRGDRWLLEWNPRFPSWMWAATLSGRNMPAVLVARALGLAWEPDSTVLEDYRFARVVTEIPVRPGMVTPQAYRHEGYEHPSQMARLARLLQRSQG